MAVHIRLARYGTKKTPFYRIVVTDQRNARDGRFIENIGTWSPLASPEAFLLDRERFTYWLGKGAAASATLSELVKKHPSPAPGA